MRDGDRIALADCDRRAEPTKGHAHMCSGIIELGLREDSIIIVGLVDVGIRLL